jgi:hypothetical protein
MKAEPASAKERDTMKPTLTHLLLGMLLCGLLFAVNSSAATDQGPDQVKLDRLVNLFDGVNFDHAAHVEIAGDCATCHHHTTGGGATGERCERCHAQSPKSAEVACHSCHVAEPFTAAQLEQKASDRYQYHVDKPGLKAAYHWNCLGCHEDSGGPTGCEDCHARNATGEAFYHSGASAPQASAAPTH